LQTYDPNRFNVKGLLVSYFPDEKENILDLVLGVIPIPESII